MILASLVTGCLVMLAVSAWYLRKQAERHVESFYRTAKVALIVLIPAIVIQMSVGNKLGEVEGQVPADEDRRGRGAVEQLQAVLVLGRPDRWVSQSNENATEIIPIPHLLSVLATGTWSGRRHRAQPAPGPVSDEVRARELHPQRRDPVLVDADHGLPRDARPAVGAVGRLAAVSGKLRTARVFLWLSVWAVITPFLMNTAGWLLTESGRQPWIVQGLQKTVNANSPSVSATDIWISLIAFVLVYIVLGAVDLILMLRYSRRGLGRKPTRRRPSQRRVEDPVPALTY